jgi:hypothetical protein
VKDYLSFLSAKVARRPDKGCEYDTPHPILFDWQREIVSWACRRGQAAIFADCGLGKTLMQVEGARHWR